MLPSHRSSLRAASYALEDRIPVRKIGQSHGEAWQEAEAQIFRRPQQKDEVLVPAVVEPLLVWVISGEAQIEECELTGEWTKTEVRTGSFFLTQTDAPYLMRWQADPERPFEVMHLYLGLALVKRAARSLGLNPSRLRMRDISGVQDAFISGVLTGLTAEIQTVHSASSLFVNGLLESLTIHLLRHYAETHSALTPRRAQLPAWKLRKALDHMEAHLAEPFDLDFLAGLCGMSRFHFSRSFHNTMGQTPSRWFVRRRVEYAKELLCQSDKSVIKLALTIGYESSSHFAQVFRRETGISPRDYRKL
ncbi:AraC family transcriptional regulator [Gluconacetobacter entanii]|uniref:AraC family transcriptional regulator n=1 Tax=Gluconacetobacter entanii TaxID=108528 RepID=UPI001C93645C|nr:AraC family transcriptional regulator [Gluconacetobacter entanii]MBY4640680.1 AraC family transcriptional regulator [Gluconacetobacter entanii]MCW4579244.1 AraC family transcriptional regulator [Gluconacetobacter entanii]MCW4582625.1 AraC family transcriptional regulator [Gluconacetobacter entanii]MCW4586028.1 AraC family transcriptional regulator [Gluconacetobacter entanii]